MSRQQISLVACCTLVLGGLVTYATHHGLRLRAARLAGREVDVIVAARDLPVGTALSEKDITLTKLSATEAPVNYFHECATILGRSVVLPISKGETILPYELGGYGDAFPSAGGRAFSVEINRAKDFPDLLQPGAQVDIVLIMRTGRGGDIGRTTAVLKNVTVVAVTRNLKHASSALGQAQGIVTLLLSPDDAQKVVNAKSKGRIQISRPAATGQHT